MKDRILDIFYNNIVKEASNGRVDCYFYYNVIFGTKIIDNNVYVEAKSDNKDLFIPTLMIKNKDEFDKLLLEYVDKAMKFYDDSNYCEEVKVSPFSDVNDGICREKVIMTLLWSNASINDFNDPISFLKKRIALIDDMVMTKYLDRQVIGYSKILGGDIEVGVVKNKLENETPYSFMIFLKDVNGEYMYEFPRVYAGTCYDDGYVYAIQNARDKITNDKYRKKVDRKLYKVNEGFDVKNDTYDEYGFGNLKDITPSFLVAANIVMGIFRSNGIDKVSVSSILIERWNSKMIVLDYNRNRLEKKNVSEEEINEILGKKNSEYLKIQSNLTEKFIRIFRRLDYHHMGVNVVSYPYETGDNMSICLDRDDYCDNELLNETYFNSYSNVYKKR